MAGLLTRVVNTLKHGWSLFQDDSYMNGGVRSYDGGAGYYGAPNRRTGFSNDQTILSSIYTRMSIDVAGIDIRHVRTDDDGRYLEDIKSDLQNCLTVEPNLDQGARQFRQDIAMSLFEEGCIAVVPVVTDIDPSTSTGYSIQQLRVGNITAWFPQHVRVSLYDDRKGERKEVTVPKRLAAVIENPLYTVMNQPNSTLHRLKRKLAMLDAVDEQVSSGKLDMIIQLPYVVKSEARRQQAEQRRKDLETQLKGSTYGIAYTDGTEKITQLNRPLENNLLKQVEYLVNQLYVQLGMTAEVMNGTADEKAMLNYFNRTVEPIVQAISEAMKRTFLTKTARAQKQSIMYFRDPFKLVPMEQLAEIVDKFTRNEVLSSNEIRAAIGIKPSKDPKADQLVNSNMPQPAPTDGSVDPSTSSASPDDASMDDASDPGGDALQSGLDELSGIMDEIFADLGIDDG